MTSINDATESNFVDVNEFVSEFELAVTPRFSMSHVNQTMTLYRGPITIEFDGEIKIPMATVNWEWRREPIILCGYDPTDAQMMKGHAFGVRREALKVSFDDAGVSAWMVHHEGTSCGAQHHVELRLLRPAVVGELGRISKAKLHLVNCPDLSDLPIRTVVGGYTGSGRLKLQSADWHILVDQVPTHDELVKGLNKHGSQAITHVLEIARSDKAEFEIDDLNLVVTDFQNFLSFATGVRPEVCLPSGCDASNVQRWEVWEACSRSEWSPLSNWASHNFSGHTLPGQVSRAFPRFMDAIKNPEWREPIALAIDWYIQARHRGLETALVLGQAALELLANTAFEQTVQQPVTPKEWDNMIAAERLCWLLQGLRIDTAIPPKLQRLIAFRLPDGSSFKSGPHALTELRNAIAHPKKKKRDRFGPSVVDLREEAAMMVIFFVEHAIISLIGFDGLADAQWTHGCFINYGPPIPQQ